MKKRILAVLLSCTLALGVFGCGAADGFKDGMEDALNDNEDKESGQTDEKSQEDTTKSEEKEEKATESAKEDSKKDAKPTETAKSDASKTKKSTKTEKSESKSEEKASEEKKTTPTPEESKNPLLDAEVKVGDVMNGTKTEKLGEYAYVTVPLDTMKKVTMEQYDEFCDQKVSDSGYNWVTIDFGNGYGLQFQGSTAAVATYGSLDNEECIEEQLGIVMMTGEDTYEYSAFE